MTAGEIAEEAKMDSHLDIMHPAFRYFVCFGQEKWEKRIVNKKF